MMYNSIFPKSADYAKGVYVPLLKFVGGMENLCFRV